MLGNFKDPVFGFAHHRGFTHSFLGIALVSALVVGFMYLVWRSAAAKRKIPICLRAGACCFCYACLAGLSHILLDFTNNYGVRPLLAVSGKMVFLGYRFHRGANILVSLIAGLASAVAFRADQRGSRRRQKGPRGSLAATVALIGVIGCGASATTNTAAPSMPMQSRTYENADPIRVSAYPLCVESVSMAWRR